MKNFIKKYIFLIAFALAFTESIILFYFCFLHASHSAIFMMASYGILLIFPIGMFIVSFKEHRTNTSLISLKYTEEDISHKKELEQFSNTRLQFYKKSFALKLNNLYTLLENNELDTANKLLGDAVIADHIISICSSNPIVNGILLGKRTECEKCGIHFEYSVLFPENSRLSFSTLISLFSNLLDNAIESCLASSVSSPEIMLSVDYKGDFLTIFMRNTKAVSHSFDPDNKPTTKSDTLSHGFGLSIIEEIASHHDGFCEWADMGNYFESLVMLRYFS